MYLSRITQSRSEEPLSRHLEQVARYGQMLGEKFAAPACVYLAGALHDMGKYSAAFQSYVRGESAAQRGEVVHSQQAVRFLSEIGAAAHPVVRSIVSNVIAAHHSELYDGVDVEGFSPLARMEENDGGALHYDKVKAAFLSENPLDFSALIIEAQAEIETAVRLSGNDAPFVLQMLTKMIYSALVDADRYCAYCFDVGKQPETRREIPPWGDFRGKLERYIYDKFSAGTALERARNRISDACERSAERDLGVFTLSVPTGGGKTLSSLRFALAHAEKHKLERIIYVIPYLSILDQTAGNIREALGCGDGYEIVLEHHSSRNVCEKPEDEQAYRMLSSRWETPIVLTTMVQFLESIYGARASKLRKFHNMAKAVIIFDEAQALPVNCIHLFNGAVNFLRDFAGSTLLLCTATTPRFDKVEHPLKFSPDRELITLTESEHGLFSRVNARVERESPPDAIAALAARKLVDGVSVLAILNTKQTAKILCAVLKHSADYDAFFLSTDLCPAHRQATLRRIRENLKVGRLTLCVSTQLVEAGVDLSFGCVIRALAGLDSVVQAAGRCNRNGENPDGGEVLIVPVAEENLTHLRDIDEGKNAVARVLREESNADPLSDAMLAKYYEYYFFNRRSVMDYPVKLNDSVYNLLTHNAKGCRAYRNLHQREYAGLHAAFRTAAEEFSVIPGGQQSVVVPYGDALDLVREFRSTRDLARRLTIIKTLGKYTVSVYSHVFQTLCDAGALVSVEDEFYVLAEQYYDGDGGLTTTPGVEQYIL